MSCVSHAFASVHCCLVVTCWERADLLALVGDAYCSFVTFQYGILGQVWYLIVSFPDICLLSYFDLILELCRAFPIGHTGRQNMRLWYLSRCRAANSHKSLNIA